ncbi:MAG TPA: TetR/AcrR family transcriptional regulator [Chloroflexota bacterium]|nr:TetR/AcrR family transcriptional regulator [Chloroflexota bacterium]
MARAAAVATLAFDVPTTSAECRTRILDATLTVVADRGYAGTTLTEVAATSAISVSDVERHFGDREECFLGAYDLAVGWVEERVRADLAGHEEGWASAVRRVVQATADLCAADPRLSRLCGAEALFAGPRAMDRHRATVARLAPGLHAGRSQYGRKGALPDDLERTLLSAAIVSLGRSPRPAELVPELTYFLLAPYMDTERAWRLAEGG